MRPGGKNVISPLDAYWARLIGHEGSFDESFLQKAQEKQWEELGKTLRYAYERSRLYRRLLDGHSLCVHSREELGRLPLTSAEDLHPMENLLCTSKDALERIVTLKTSGTTGMPKRVAFSRGDLERTMEFFRWGLAMFGDIGPRVAILLSGANRPMGVVDLLRQSLRETDSQCFWPDADLLRSENGYTLASWLSDLCPTLLIAMPSQLERLLPLLPKGIRHLKGVLASAERLSVDLAQSLRREWQCEVLNHYGLTEAGFGGAVECQAHDGMHIRPMDLMFEIISLDGQTILPMGEVGEIVVTTLGREAMPLIRYRTSDVGFLQEGVCACGSLFPRLGSVEGRVRFGEAGDWRWVHRSKGRSGLN